MTEPVDILNERGEHTGEVIDRKIAHERGLWHKGVVLFILKPDNSEVLLQQRANNPNKPWPGFWDVSVGGHVGAGEYGYQAVVREAKEELGLDFNPHDFLFIGATTSSNETDFGKINHFNEYYVVNRDVNVADLNLQKEEVQAAKWFTVKELEDKIAAYTDITDKRGCWEYILRYLKNLEK